MPFRYRPSRTTRARRALAPYFAVAALVGAALVFGERLGDGGPRRPHVPAAPEAVRGVKPGAIVAGRATVIDGDTLAVAGRRIRLPGIDAPEKGQRCGAAGGEYDCGEAAKRALAALIGAATVECRAEDRDRWGRIVARCHVAGRDLGAAMVEAGWALSGRSEYAALERAARTAKRGVWQGAFAPPARWRREHPR